MAVPQLSTNNLWCSNLAAFMSNKEKPVAQRHQMVSSSLALLFFIGLDPPLGSRAAAPIGDDFPYVRTSVRPSVRTTTFERNDPATIV